MSSPRKRLLTIIILVIIIIAGAAFASWADVREMDKSSARIRTCTCVLGTRWPHEAADTPLTRLLNPPLDKPEWTPISGGSWAASVDPIWSNIAVAFFNVTQWMNQEKVPETQQRRVASELLQIAHRDNRLNVGYQDDRIIIYDGKGTLLLECVKPTAGGLMGVEIVPIIPPNARP